MTVITQQNLDDAAEALADLITLTKAAAVELCVAGDAQHATNPAAANVLYDNRDRAYLMLAKLYEAKSLGGGFTIPSLTRFSGAK